MYTDAQKHFAIRSRHGVMIEFETCPGFVSADNVAGNELARSSLNCNERSSDDFCVLTVQEIELAVVYDWLNSTDAVVEYADDIEVSS